MASGTRDTTITFTANVLSAALALGTQACLAWLLGPDGRGEYAVAMILGALLVKLAQSSQHFVSLRAIGQGKRHFSLRFWMPAVSCKSPIRTLPCAF